MIGKGSFGSVFLATSRKPRSRFCCYPPLMAVKSADFSVSGSLQKEKEVLYKLPNCPQVVRCYAEETTTNLNGDMVYNVLLEYASGGTLAGLIEKSSGFGLPEREARRYTWFVLKGLSHVHKCGYVHCDLKPENILLVPTGDGCDEPKFVAKIGDFGLAKTANQSTKRRLLDPYLRGTAQYMAPEAIVDGTQEAPSDIWALGCVVLEMLTGNRPWDGTGELKRRDLLHKIGYGRELPNIPSSVSKDCRDFLKACLVRNAKYRLTAEMLLDHPFVSGIGEEDGDGELEGLGVGFDVERICSLSYDSEDGDELSSSCSSYCSSSSEEDRDGEGNSTVETSDIDVTARTTLQVPPSDPTKKFSAAYVIPAGA